MEESIVFKNVLDRYVDKQNVEDKSILNLFVFKEEYDFSEIAKLTGYSLNKINDVINQLKLYITNCGYA